MPQRTRAYRTKLKKCVLTADEIEASRSLLIQGQEALRNLVWLADNTTAEDMAAADPEFRRSLELAMEYRPRAADLHKQLAYSIETLDTGVSLRVIDTSPFQAYTSFHPASDLEVSLGEALSDGVSIPAGLLFAGDVTITSLRLYSLVRAAGWEDTKRGEARLCANQAWMCQRMSMHDSTITKAAAVLRRARYLETRRGIYGKDTYEYVVSLNGCGLPYE